MDFVVINAQKQDFLLHGWCGWIVVSHEPKAKQVDGADALSRTRLPIHAELSQVWETLLRMSISHTASNKLRRFVMW
jgi:hypothetical protein